MSTEDTEQDQQTEVDNPSAEGANAGGQPDNPGSSADNPGSNVELPGGLADNASSHVDHPAGQAVGAGGDAHAASAAGKDSRGAAVRFPPPVLFLLLILVAAGLDYLWPLGMGVPQSFEVVGIAMCLFGVAVAILVNGTFKRVGTAIEPWKPTTSLITSGWYSYSRNPIYLGFCLFNMGIGIASNSLWIFFSFIPGAIGVYHIAIKKEEIYLAQKFGEEYARYKASVRRWI